jgi:glycogen(starch) synthase
MRIGFFVWEYPPSVVGGLGTYAEYITREFVALGHDVTVFTLNNGNQKTREVMKGVEVHRPINADVSNVFPMFVTEDLKKWGTNIRFFNDIFIYNVLSATKFINSLLKKEGYRFDIACVHDWLSSISGIIVKNETKVPVVFHVHSTEFGRSGGNGSGIVSHFETATAEMADHIITVSHAMREDLIRHGWPSHKISAVWNGVDPERYDPEKCKKEDVQKVRERYGIPENGKMLFFLGRLTWVKGIRSLMQAMPLVLEEYPNTKLVILGKGEEQKDVTETANRLGIAKNVMTCFEFLPEEERILHYAASDLCIFPSIYEPFGIVSLEAMSMAKPLIVGAQGVVGFKEQVLSSWPEQNGIHINGSDPADIAWGIKEVVKDEERAKRWGQNGRKRVVQYFTWRKAAEQTLQIYETIQGNSAKEKLDFGAKATITAAANVT